MTKINTAVWIASAIALMGIALAVLLTPTQQLTFVREVQAQEEELPATTTPEVKLHPALRPVCGCESSYEGTWKGEPQQFETNGEVRRGRVNRADVGMCQINLFYHGEAAEKMGVDLFTKEGNITYANHLYETQGLGPWIWSKPCWNKAQ